MRRTASETRTHVLQIAHDLFYWHGIRAVGVDRVAAEAGIAPTTLNRLFASKDDLVAAYVQRADRLYREWFMEATKADGRHPRERILALFDALAQQVRPEQCRGCPFLMALAELPDPALAAHLHAKTLKAWVRAQLRDLAAELADTSPAIDPTTLGDQLALVMEGVYASAQALGADGPARQARALTEMLLAPARPRSG
jgi:AcrR family transcriptional regulator